MMMMMMIIIIGEFTQQGGRKKRTTKRSSVKNVAGLLVACFVVILTWHKFFLKISVIESIVWRKVVSSKIIVTLFTQGLPSSFLSHPLAYVYYYRQKRTSLGTFFRRMNKYVTTVYLNWLSTGEDHIMLGSLTQPNSSDPNVPFSAPYVQSMLSKCKDLCPRLHALKDSDLQVTVGIRPGREQIRVEQDPDDSSVFHNYGHYRWGMTLNWGSAADIVNLIDKEFKTNFRQSQLTTNKRLHLAKL